ncbi:hypothetical protein HII36_48715 [Nonomuraea sp. NN258]|uniref:hypothetical protein n=1 Tax=Nonomuraea antri TaxID=2730852 RepID=UPI001567CA92|nr:hypothetical protein [Nonomuraea antri]NRQ39663.1 hypothetical protein [Nonomuraea antri]
MKRTTTSTARPAGTVSRTRGGGPTRWRRIGWVVTAALVVAGVVVLIAGTGGGASAPPPGLSASATPAQVLKLGPDTVVTRHRGEPVVGAEVLRAADVVRAEVISQFSRQGVALGPGFWDRPHQGVTPGRRLRELAVAAAVRDKARRVWAREAGLLADVGEAAFQRDLRAENQRRAEARAAGRPLPGVPSYDAYTYAQVRAAELDSELAKRFGDTLDLPESRLRAHYAELATAGGPGFEQARENVRRSLIRTEYERELDRRAALA